MLQQLSQQRIWLCCGALSVVAEAHTDTGEKQTAQKCMPLTKTDTQASIELHPTQKLDDV